MMPARRILQSGATAALLWAAVALPAGAAGGEIRVEPEVQAHTEATVAADAKSRRVARRASRPAIVDLGRLPAEAQRLEEHRKGAPLRIGIGRPVDALASEDLAASRLAWESLPEGGRVAAVALRSPEARAVRAGIRVGRLPAAARVRFYASATAETFEVAGEEILATLERNRASGERGEDASTYWSPPIAASDVVVEIEVPAGTEDHAVRLAIPRLSHLTASPEDGFADAKASAACQNDATCSKATWGHEIDSVARMVFTDGGGSYLCTGTLLADGDATTSIPYFLSANHCISTQSVASSLATYWFYRSKTCGSAQLEAYASRTGGAVLLHASTATDISFMRLNAAPPAGAAYAGWIVNPSASLGTDVTGIHHPRGDPLKASFGDIAGYASCTASTNGTFTCSNASSTSGAYYVVTWRDGVTEPGSSGSGLFRDSGRYLIGQLYGGSSSCAAPAAGDIYGRFDFAYNSALSQWLSPQSAAVSISKSGAGSGRVASSPAGIDCGATCSKAFTLGTSVTLQATPVAGSVFTGWSGACSGTGSCVVSVNGPKAVGASFALAPRTLTVTRTGSGSGTISSTPAGIQCGATCSASFAANTAVTLTAVAATGSTFRQWSGACTGTGGCTVTMSDAKSVVATFDPIPPAPAAQPVVFPAARIDFDGDGKHDLAWRRATDNLAGLWKMNGALVPAYGAFYGPAGAVMHQLGDFDGDGDTDILWRAGGGYWLTLMNGLDPGPTTPVFTAVDQWEVTAVGDFNGDGKADLLWRNGPGGTHGIWLMNGAAATKLALASPGPGWNVAAVGDFDGNGRSDLLWRRDGEARFELMNGATVVDAATYAVPATWTVEHVADFNGDGKADPLWRRNDALHGAWLMDGKAQASAVAFFGPGNGDVVRVADFDGDGRGELLWRGAGGSYHVSQMEGAAMASTTQIFPGDGNWGVVGHGDFDGDGKADLLWRAAADNSYGTWIMDGASAVAKTLVIAPGTAWHKAP